jgi:hypothetical protein
MWGTAHSACGGAQRVLREGVLSPPLIHSCTGLCGFLLLVGPAVLGRLLWPGASGNSRRCWLPSDWWHAGHLAACQHGLLPLVLAVMQSSGACGVLPAPCCGSPLLWAVPALGGYEAHSCTGTCVSLPCWCLLLGCPARRHLSGGLGPTPVRPTDRRAASGIAPAECGWSWEVVVVLCCVWELWVTLYLPQQHCLGCALPRPSSIGAPLGHSRGGCVCGCCSAQHRVQDGHGRAWFRKAQAQTAPIASAAAAMCSRRP